MLHDYLRGLRRAVTEKPGICSAITEAFASSEAIGTTEHSMPFDAAYAAGTNKTDDGVYQLFLDLNDMVAGDQLQIRIYEKVQSGGTQRIIYESVVSGVQSPPSWVSPSLILMHGWDMTLDALAGTITVEWSIRKLG
jgi:hypothetical protein